MSFPEQNRELKKELQKGLKKELKIGDIARHLGVETHVLRHWEKKIPEFKPTRNSRNRRYYTQRHINLGRRILKLVRGQGMPLESVRRALVTPTGKKQMQALAELSQTIDELRGIEDRVKALKSNLSP